MKKFLSIVLSLAMVFSLSATAFAAENTDTSDTTDKISRSEIESLFSSKPETRSTLSLEDEQTLFLETIDQIQQLYFEQEAAINNGESTSDIDAEIAELESLVNQLPHAVHLTDDTPMTRGVKPTLPASNTYTSVYAYDKTGTYGGKTYDVFEIYCASKRFGGLGNNLGYKGELVLLSDSKYDKNAYMQKEIEAVGKFIAGTVYTPFAVADFLILSQLPSFFDDGASQRLTASYTVGQTFVYSYVADKGINWFEHTQTTEQASHSDTVIAASIKNGITQQRSKSNNVVYRGSYYPTSSTATNSANNAAKLYATSNTQYYFVGPISYYVNGVKKATINTNSFNSLWSIPGL